ncbi:hypothetical protein SSX86_028535 [Deinandra increscens subsp. villosa]|uniref:F-ATPase gamma subunit n=1 Tax=Deinandra increscens subsp. villosa TaxID=3103831 RepID=A0AAP0CE76_9ASTR
MDFLTFIGIASLLAGGLYWLLGFAGAAAEQEKRRAIDVSFGSIDIQQVQDKHNQYLAFFSRPEDASKPEKVSDLVNLFYDLITDMYEHLWGQSFHFSPAVPGKTHPESTRIHEEMVADLMGANPNPNPSRKILDVGCGVGGPMRTIATRSGSSIVGITINECLDIAEVAKKVGFEVVKEKDLAKPPAGIWWSRLKKSKFKMWKKRVMVMVLEKLGFVAKGTGEALENRIHHSVLCDYQQHELKAFGTLTSTNSIDLCLNSYNLYQELNNRAPMAMAALRREGRRFLPLVSSPNPINAIRSTLAPTEEQVGLGVRSISTQIVRNRMKSVRNIQKITKAMKMVAASKLRAIQVRAENSRGLWQPFTALLGDTPSVNVKKNVIVTVTSDKGLCGGINSTSVKISRALYKINSGPETECKYVILGEKGKAQLIRDSKKDIDLTMTELQKNFLNYTQVSVLADDILKNVEFDALRIVFNKFQSVVSFLPTTATVLSPETVERESEAGGKIGDLDSYEIEGGETKSEVLQNLAEFQFSCVLFNAVLENACSEQGARMSAMDSSSRNAGDMLDRLTLTYNRTRQASITTELIEIISGASALTVSAFAKNTSNKPEDFNPQSPLFSGVRQYIAQEDLNCVAGFIFTQCWGLFADFPMDFDEYEYLENMVENSDAPKSEQRANGGEETVKNEDKERRHSSRHRSDKHNDDRRSKRAKSGEESRDREKERGSSHHRSSPKDGDRDRQRSHRETRDRDRDRDMEKDHVRGRREHERGREEREKDKEHDRAHRSGSRSERHGNERDREKSRDKEVKDREKEKEKEREVRDSDRESRRYKDKKEGAVEPEVDPERDQRTVFAYQISLKADERDVYEFFSRAGKVRDVRLIMDRNSRRSKGVGYIEFYDAMSVPMAIALSGQPLLGHPVMVKPSEAEKNLVQSTATVGGIAGGTGATGGARKLYVGNLHYNMKEDQLRQVFESFGTVELVQLPTDETGNCKGFGFIQFARLEDARAAQSLNGQLEIAGRMMKVSAITDQPGMQEIGVNPGDFDDDDGGGLALNARSRALLMQKLDRSGTATRFNMNFNSSFVFNQYLLCIYLIMVYNIFYSGVGTLGIPTTNGTGLTSGLSAIASMPVPPVTVPSVESIGVPSECLLLNNMFDPELEDEPDFDLDIKEDVQSECSKHGKLRHIYVEKNSAGFVYLRFENTQSAVAAQRALHGRWFAGKMITATFMVPQNYEAKFPDSI